MIGRGGLAAAALALSGCGQTPLFCHDAVTAGALSPDGAHVANLVVRECPWSGYELRLTLRSSRDTRPGPAVAVFAGAWPAELQWKGPRRLVVLPDARSKVLYQQKQWDGVSLDYGSPGDTDRKG